MLDFSSEIQWNRAAIPHPLAGGLIPREARAPAIIGFLLREFATRAPPFALFLSDKQPGVATIASGASKSRLLTAPVSLFWNMGVANYPTGGRNMLTKRQTTPTRRRERTSGAHPLTGSVGASSRCLWRRPSRGDHPAAPHLYGSYQVGRSLSRTTSA